MMRSSVPAALLMVVTLLSCKQENSGQPTVNPPADTVKYYTWDTFSMGADLSYVSQIEDNGAVYRDSSKVQDPFLILKNHGTNTVRVRLWYNPQWEVPLTGGKLYSDLADAEKTIRRAKTLGMAVSLDIHYSDTWADAGHQDPPAAWVGLGLTELRDSVYQYTLSVLNYLKSKSLVPEMVQVGNETNIGMLFPQGKVVSDNWVPFGQLLNAGIRAVRDFSATSDVKPKIILHVAQLQNAEWWIDKVMYSGKVSDFDILGISHYAKWSTVKTMPEVTSIIKKIRMTYGKTVMIVETAYPWTGGNADTYPNIMGPADGVSGYPLTPAGQEKYLEDLTQAVISGGGKGVMYWEPAWITSSMHDLWGTGSAWDNCTLFDFTGNSLQGMNYQTVSYSF
jgi:arabinogalactan endo-1,4-beta-galactosidase